jgi:hypothetical protein
MIPSRLVPVRRYAAGGSRGDAILGADDRLRLLNAGIEAYVKFDRHFGPALVVPESQAAAACRVLADTPDLFQHRAAPPCPQCHTFHPDVRPPYELMAVGAGFLGAAGLVFAGGSMGIAIAVLTAGVIGAAIMSSRLPRLRCHACGYAWDDASQEPRYL